jgi:hypothetical protein
MAERTIFAPDSDETRPVATLDFEASALPGPGSYPIEVAVAFVDECAVRSWLIRPRPEWLANGIWDPAAARLHGITREMLTAEGQAPERVAAELQASLDGFSVITDAVSADTFWLELLFDGRPPFRLGALRDLLISRSHPQAIGEVERAEEIALRRFPQQHRAGPDAQRMAEAIRIFAGEA